MKKYKVEFSSEWGQWDDLTIGEIAGHYAEQKQFFQAKKVAQNIELQYERNKWMELIKCASEQQK